MKPPSPSGRASRRRGPPLAVAVALAALPAHAQPPAGGAASAPTAGATGPAVAPARVVVAPAGGLGALAVAFDSRGQLRARACAAAPCAADDGPVVPPPAGTTAPAAGGRVRAVTIGAGRSAALAEVPLDAGRTWTVLLAAPPSGEAPVVLLDDVVGLVSGVEGERSGPMIDVRDGLVHVGVQREGRDLCGRPALLSPRVVDPATLTLRPAKLQRLPEAERAAAPHVEARPLASPASLHLLHARWATSVEDGTAVAALTDGKPDTVWGEGRGGTGRGELVVTSAPREVPLTAFELTLPAPAPSAHGVAPESLWLATDRELFRVTVPPLPAGGTVEVVLPSPVQTGCAALVLEGAAGADRDAVVRVAELTARPATPTSPDELVAALSAGGSGAAAAAAVLREVGGVAFERLATAFPTLGEDARRLALDVLDDAPCAVAAPVYVQALVGPHEAHRLHARGALGRCRDEAARAFATALATANARVRRVLAGELAEVEPVTAIRTLVPFLAAAKGDERDAYAAAIGHAARATAAAGAVGAALTDPALSAETRLRLLRALGPALAEHGDAAARAFVAVAWADDSLRTRYLSLTPAAALAATRGEGRAFLREALSDRADPHVRAEAARVLASPAPFLHELARGAQAPDVRVREASLQALARGEIAAVRPYVEHALRHDEWPLVRAAAARTFAALGPDPGVDGALGDALGDTFPSVRRAALVALGARRALPVAPRIRERLADEAELVGVRASAAVALGLVCDASAVAPLTAHALRLTNPMADEQERVLGKSAIAALALLAPKDLGKRLAPLVGKDAPPAVRRLALAAVASRGRCGAGAGGR